MISVKGFLRLGMFVASAAANMLYALFVLRIILVSRTGAFPYKKIVCHINDSR